MAQYSGKNGVLYMSATAAGAAVPFLYRVDWSFNSAAGTSAVTHMGNMNARYVQHIPDAVITLNGMWDDTYDAYWDNSRSADGVRFYLYPTSLVATKYWYGPAWWSCDSIEGGVDSPVTEAGTLSANGDWGQY